MKKITVTNANKIEFEFKEGPSNTKGKSYQLWKGSIIIEIMGHLGELFHGLDQDIIKLGKKPNVSATYC
jgi:hypothetical protein